MVHYDVQLIGGIQLHLGRIAEMATGEGKTLVATLPLYLNALPGKGAHLVTVNSYLARRDSQWMGHLYQYLGLTVGCLDDTEPGTPERRAAYDADITYGTNNEFGFDYLRDNMVIVARPARAAAALVRDRRRSGLGAHRRSADAAHHLGSGRERERRDVRRAQRVGRAPRAPADGGRQLTRRPKASALLDEKNEEQARIALYKAQLGSPKNKRLLKALQEQGVKQLVQKMELDYIADRKLAVAKQQFGDLENDLLLRPRREGAHGAPDRSRRRVHVTDGPRRSSCSRTSRTAIGSHRPRRGDARAGEGRGAPRSSRSNTRSKSEKLHIVHQLLRAHALYEKDVNYVVQEGEVLIVDEFTGRTMPGRRWSEGLHQAVEAKEARAGEGRDADARHDHDPELLPHVRQAGGHDRYRRDGRDGVPPDLQAGSRGHPDEQGRSFATTGTTSSTRRVARSTTRSSEEDAAPARPWLSGAGRYDERRRVGDAVAHVQARGSRAQRAERQVPPARSRDRRGRGPAGGDHDRDEHGRPRNRHQTRPGRHDLEAVAGEGPRRQDGRRRRRSAACTSSAPSGTSRGASTASCAVARAVRAIRVRRSSSCRSKTT